MRIELGYEPLEDKSADALYQNQSLQPITDDGNEEEAPEEMPEENPEEEKAYISRFREILRTYKDINGNRVFKDKEINALAS